MAVPYALRRLFELSALDRDLLLRAGIALGWTDLVLRLIGLQRVLRRIEMSAMVDDDSVTLTDLRRAQHYARWIEAAARHHALRVRCLHRSLVLHQWLRREALPSVLRIGVLKEEGSLRAHAWVELAGRVVNDREKAVARFTPMSAASPWENKSGAHSRRNVRPSGDLPVER